MRFRWTLSVFVCESNYVMFSTVILMLQLQLSQFWPVSEWLVVGCVIGTFCPNVFLSTVMILLTIPDLSADFWNSFSLVIITNDFLFSSLSHIQVKQKLCSTLKTSFSLDTNHMSVISSAPLHLLSMTFFCCPNNCSHDPKLGIDRIKTF